MAGLPVNQSTTVYGDKLMLYYDGKPIALGQSCQIDITAETIDTTTKMSGNWKEFLTGQLSYTLSSEALLTYSTAAVEGVDMSKFTTFADLLKLYAKRNPVEFKLAVSKDASADFAADVEFLSGTAIINQLSANAQMSQLTTCSIQMQGSGELTIPDGFSAPTTTE